MFESRSKSRIIPILAWPLLAIGCTDDPTMMMMEGETWALSFDGIDDYVQVADAPALDVTTDVTLSVWFYFTGTISGVPGRIQKDGPGSWGRYGLWAFDDRVEFCIFIDQGSQSCLDSTGTMTPNTWHHIAGVYDGASMRLYLDGELDSETPLTGAISTSDLPLYIGSDPTESGAVVGYLHEVCVWNIARSQSEIQSDMDDRMMGSEPGLVGLWHMDEGMGSMAADASPTGLSAMLGSMSGMDSADPMWVATTWPH